MRLLFTVLLAFAATIPTQVVAGQRADAGQAHQGFDVRIPYAPAAVPVGGQVKFVYELHLANYSSDPLKLHHMRIESEHMGIVLAEMSNEQLAATIAHSGPAGPDALSVPPGATVVVYVNAAAVGGKIPRRLVHSLDYLIGTADDAKRGSVLATTAVDKRPLPMLSPPLRGGYWTAIYDPALERGHRQVVYAVDGKARIPGRFAIDWMASSPMDDGLAANGLGAEVLAVADGTVASVRDGVPEPIAGQPRPSVGMADATGNYISIKIGEGRFAFYEHLMPGLSVKPGQRVRRGQVIGRLGSTGQAWRPHLHFHLADADSPLAAEGLPYVMTDVKVAGAYGSIAAFESGESWLAGPAKTTSPAFPAPNVVVCFDGNPRTPTRLRRIERPSACKAG